MQEINLPAGVEREIEIALRTIDLCVPDGIGAYLAGPISTGRRYYEELVATGTRSLAELVRRVGIERYLKSVRWPNVTEGEELAQKIRDSGVPFLINTGPLFLSGWSSADYMNFCLRLLRRKVRCVYFHPEWAFSEGAVQEYLYCLEAGIEMRSHDDDELTEREALSALERTVSYLDQFELPSQNFRKCLDLLAVGAH